jgi:ABC-type nitrate/sulfonate/bicarbonate transport system substrate-binding protein
MIRRAVIAMGSLAALGVALLLGLSGPAAAQGKKMIFAVPGIPPVFSTTIAYVAERQGFFKKYGVEVEVRPFDTGAAAARAVAAGDIDFAISPSPLIVSQISNADVNLVGIYGLPRPDWLIGSIDPAKGKCADIAGNPVGVDSVGGARSIALREMLAACDVKIDQVQQVALSSNVGAAMIAGRLTYGVLHLDDVPVIEAQRGKPLTTVTTMQKTNPNSHYLLGVARIDRVAQNRDGYVRLLAALIDTARYMSDPANADTVAAAAAPTGHSKEDSKAALQKYLELGVWAVDKDGLDKDKLESVIEVQKKIGGIQPGKQAVSYERLADGSVWRDAAALVKQKSP